MRRSTVTAPVLRGVVDPVGQGAFADGGPARVQIGPGERERAGAGLDHCAGCIRVSAGDGQVGAQGGHVNRARGPGGKDEVAIGRGGCSRCTGVCRRPGRGSPPRWWPGRDCRPTPPLPMVATLKVPRVDGRHTGVRVESGEGDGARGRLGEVPRAAGQDWRWPSRRGRRSCRWWSAYRPRRRVMLPPLLRMTVPTLSVKVPHCSGRPLRRPRSRRRCSERCWPRRPGCLR